MIQIITRISVFGILISTAALVILVGAFNGIESMVKQLYSDFDASIVIRSEKGKTFNAADFPYQILKNNPNIDGISKAVEEIVVLKHGQKWSNATLYGVENSFLKMSDMEHHLVDGTAFLHQDTIPFAVAGAGLLQKMQAFISDVPGEFQRLDIYFPLREAKLRLGSSPFNNRLIRVSAAFNFNRDVNYESIVVPLEFAQKELDYGKDITCIYVHVPQDDKILAVQKTLKQQLGAEWSVKTQFEKNELIYKTSKTERLIVIGILIFVFIIAAFNLMTALVMSILEKKENIRTMYSFGMTKQMMVRVFFYNGMMIALKGILLGLLVGYLVCWAQIQFGLIRMQTMLNNVFPVKMYFSDALLILGIVLVLSFITTFFPVKYLLNRTKQDE